MSLDEFGTESDRKVSPPNVDPITIIDTEIDSAITRLKKEKKQREASICQWSLCGPNTFCGVGDTQEILEPGVYSITASQGVSRFVKKDINIDALIEFPDSKADGILTEIEEFWKRGKYFEDYGFLHRRGYLLYGKQGSGKTSIVQQVVRRIVDHEGIVFLCNSPNVFTEGLSVFRKIEPNRHVVCIFEDIDSIINVYGEDALLSVLDGETQINRVLNVATTNYPERLDARIASRPRRFDRVLKIGMPEKAVRKAYFQKKLKIDDKEIDTWVNATEDFSFASMSELVISVKCLGNSFEESVARLRELMDNKPSSSNLDGGKVGFGR